jgi:hypothetical protein
LIGGAELDTTDGFCESNNLVPPSTTSSSRCGGSSTVTISYANVPQDLHGQFADTLTIWQYVPVVINGVTEFGWVDLSQYGGQPAYNFETKTVTAISPFGPGIFVLAFPGDGSGGGGGAMGFAGAGIVLDLVAPVVSETPISESTTSLPDTTTLNADDDDTSVNVSATVSATQEPVKSGVGQGEESDVVAISRNGNTTIAVPGAGNVTLSFTNLISEGELTVSAAKDSDLGGFKVVKNGGDPAKLMSLDNVPYSLAGNVFVIGPPDSEFKGTMTVSVPFKQALVPSGSEVRLLHYTGSGWEDVTTQSTHLDLVSGSLNSLGAVAPAVKSQAINLVSAVQ